MNKKIFLYIYIALILIDISTAFIGTSTSYGLRASVGISPINENTTSFNQRSLSDYLSFNQSTTNFYSRFGILNLRPSIPILNSPINDSHVKSIPELNWSNSTDPELFSTITYIVEISDNINFQYTNYSNDTVRETSNVTQDSNFTLTDETTFYWRVRSYDQYDNSTAFSEIWQFTIDFTSPSEFNLTSPDNETNSTDNSPALSWQETTEINFDEYLIEFSNQSDFSIINFSFSNVGTVANNSFSQWNSTEVLSSGTWYWRVTAYDKARNSNQTGAFVYEVGVGQQTVTTETTVTQQTGTGQTRGPRQLQQVALDIIQPSPLSLFTNDTIITPIFITNKGDTALRNINLDAIANISYLDLQLAQETIDILLPGQAIAIDLIIRSTPETLIGQHEVLIEANVLEPSFKDSAKFFINLLEFGFGERKIVLEKIEVINKLFDGNPDCLELRTLVDQAEVELNNQNYNKALSLVEAAIQACKDLVASLGKELVIEPKRRDYYIAILETLAALILFMLIYRYYKKRKIIQKLKKK